MEFPDVGAHCSEPSCKRLDFLPLKCDACAGIFCKDHIAYARHRCTSAYGKDVQVPVCPLCNMPVPGARGEPPDRAVGDHIDRDCRSDPAQRKRKIFTKRCGRAGCRQREMMELTCQGCGRNFCLRHRHPLDHACPGEEGRDARVAAIPRAQGLFPDPPAPAREGGRIGTPIPTPSRMGAPPPHPALALQNGLSEDEALQRALELSLAEAARWTTPSRSAQEEDDLALARALAASEEEERRSQAEGRGAKPTGCSLC
ncbi:AN1-type zinc finger protein 2B [Tachyglossus aculeatus]|uniref:AN1-type zinc finger protein 2B n=1 Tax=Tachyglossus aculeatus TaxID=9261 RepID=UPI0018F29ABD|nr:AN1-type zinc finger protein 2B [Tachyglossus aculeatus]